MTPQGHLTRSARAGSPLIGDTLIGACFSAFYRNGQGLTGQLVDWFEEGIELERFALDLLFTTKVSPDVLPGDTTSTACLKRDLMCRGFFLPVAFWFARYQQMWRFQFADVELP